MRACRNQQSKMALELLNPFILILPNRLYLGNRYMIVRVTLNLIPNLLYPGNHQKTAKISLNHILNPH